MPSTKLFASGWCSILLSTSSALGKERPVINDFITCSDWVEDVMVCGYDRNNDGKDDEVATWYRNEETKHVTEIQMASDGKNVDRVLELKYDLLGNITEVHDIGEEQLYLRFTFFYDAKGKCRNEYLYDHAGRVLLEALDTNDDGKIDHAIRTFYDHKGNLTEKVRDTDGDGRADQRFNLIREEWQEIKVYKPEYYIW